MLNKLPAMTKLFPAILLIFITSIGCENLHDGIDSIPDGVYTGTFQRQPAFGGGDTAQVTIIFSSNNYSGVSDKPKYPALCDGTYSIEKQKIKFMNTCIWTAEFDWSLILSGEYDFSLNGKQLIITRSYLDASTDTWTDKYILTKQE
jgi:hypothetical protein